MQVTQKDGYSDSVTPKVEPSKQIDIPESSVEMPYSEKHTEYVDLTGGITSKFIFYPYNTLSIKPFTLGCIRKVYRAVSTSKMSHMAEVISFCIDPDKSALNLTVKDFWSLMFWERINSYKKAPYKVKFKCNDEKHLDAVDAGKVKEETLVNEQIIKSTNDLELIWIDADKTLQFIARIQEEYGVSLYPARMSDVIELENLQAVGKDKATQEQNDELEWIAKLASNLNKSHGTTLQERIDFLTDGDISPDLLNEIEEFVIVSDHGIREKLHVKCKECGAERDETLSFDALTFFPSDN